MNRRTLFVFCAAILFSTLSVAGQARSVTDRDLEAYKRDRLRAEREYRENYQRLGLPSPEEIERRRAQDRIETEQLAARLRADRLERERLAARRATTSRVETVYEVAPENGGAVLYYESRGRYYRRYPRHRGIRGRFPVQSGYFAGGQFWPTPRVDNRPRPSFRVHRR